MEKHATNSTHTILLVDPNIALRSQIEGYLTDCGFRVVKAIDGREALRAIASCSDISVLFSKITLPGNMDGFSLALKARSERPGLMVVLSTSDAMAFHKAQFLRDEITAKH